MVVLAQSQSHDAARLGLMTSSRVPAIYPQAKHYFSQLQVKLMIQGKYQPPPPANPRALKRGKRLERGAIEEAAEDLDLEVLDLEMVRHANGWTGDSADSGLIVPATGELVAVTEAKTIALNQLAGWGIPHTDQVPFRVLVQAMWHLIHYPTVQVCYIPVIMGGFDFAFDFYVVKRDEEALGILLEDAERWYHDFVVKDREPPLEPDDAEPHLWRTPYELQDSGEMTPELLQWANEKLRWAKVSGEAKAFEKMAAAMVRRLTLDYGAVRGDGVSITHRYRTTTTVDHEAVVADLLAAGKVEPEVVKDLIQKHTKKSVTRSLTVNATKQPKQADTQEKEAA